MISKKGYGKYKHLNWAKTVEVLEDSDMGLRHIIQMPELQDPSEIFFIDDDYEDAYWNRERILKKDYKPIWFKFIPNETVLVRQDELELEQKTEFDDDGYAITLNRKDSEYIRFCYEREMDRRTTGVYVRIGNDIVWITGDHWFTLMWCKTKRPDKKGDYFDYREYQRDFFYIIHNTIANKLRGCDWSKAKKTGITNLMWMLYLNRSTMTKNVNLGHMSIDSAKAAKTFRDHFMYAYNGLILALKPDIKSKSEAEGIIVFGKRYNSKASKRNLDNDELNTTVMCVATMINAFDVDVFYFIWYDEAPKYKPDFGEIFRSNSGATMIQDFQVGYQWITSYTPEQSGISFTEAKKIFFNSELKTITEHSEGKTKSGLICCHIPAYKSWATAFDKYGKCNEKEAKEKIRQELDALLDRPQEYLKKRRELANTKKDAWSVADSSSIFDPIRLAELDLDLEDLQRSTQTFEWGHYEWDNLIWEVGKKDKRPKSIFGPVKWVPLTKEEVQKGKTDKVRRYESVHKTEENESLRYGKDEWGNLNPPPRFKNTGGIDPADFRDAGNAEEGSMIAAYTMPLHNPVLNTANNRVVTKIAGDEYLARPDNPEEWYQDIVKMIIYHSCLFTIEANNGTISTRLEDEGLGHYMMWKNEENILSLYLANHKNIEGKVRKHIRNSKSGGTDTIADIILYIKNYLQRGNLLYGEIDYGALIKSERLIKQLKEFEADDTKKYDLVMAIGYALMCHENYLALLVQPVQETAYKDSEMRVVMQRLAKSF